MENAPLTTESTSEKPDSVKDEKKEKSKNKKKKQYGAFLVESEPKRDRVKESSKEDEKPEESLWEILKKKSEEVEPASETEAPTEKLGNNEETLAKSALAEAALNDIPEHAGEEEITPEVAADLAAQAFLEQVKEGHDVETAAAETLTSLNAEDHEIAAAETEKPGAAEPENEDEEAPSPQLDEEIVFDRSADTEPEADPDLEPAEAQPANAEADEDVPAAAVPPPPVPPATPPPAPPGGHGLNIQPPLPSRTPIPTQSGNLYHTPITPDSPYVERYDQGNPAVTALIGAIIGYFIGRRRGRIRTEKRLLPIQKKLEKQVEDLHWEIKRKESTIRRVAAEKVRREGPFVIETLVEARAAKTEKPPKPTLGDERLPMDRRPAPEASQLHGSNKAHEHLGHMLVTAEAARQIKREKPTGEGQQPSHEKQAENEPDRKLTERHIETLNRAELLRLSEKIIVDGTSLRRIYETHLIGERGLRRLVAEHLRGGDVKKILRREIVEHEIDFERDPSMRDIAVASQSENKASTAPANATLNQLLEQASAGFGDNPEAAYYRARAEYEAHENDEQHSRRRLVDIGLVLTIAVLLALVVTLYLSRR